MTFEVYRVFYHSAASLARRAIPLALIAITLFATVSGALAAPVVAPTRPAAQNGSTPNSLTPNIPNAPFGLFLPSITSDRSRTETLEVSVVRLAQSASAEPATGTETETVGATLNDTVTLLQENFNADFPTGDWRAFDQDGAKFGEYTWDEDDFRSLDGKSSAWVANGGQNGLDPEFNNYPDNLQSWMIYGPFDLSNAASAKLTFSYWNLSEIYYDHLGWYASPNGTDFYGMRVSGDSQGWKPVTLDFAAVPTTGNLLGDSSVWIAFLFTSDGYTTHRGAFVDQVQIQEELREGCQGRYEAEYFNNEELSGAPTISRCEDAPINQNWGTSGPGNGLDSDHFSARWSGAFDFDEGYYNFVAIADDGVRVWLDNNQILNNWQDQSLTPNMATRHVSAGKHSVRVEYYEGEGGATLQFRWLRSDTTVSNRQAFDTCFLPSPGEMQAWWGNSPYYEIGIYIGGSNRGCKAHNQQYLTANWVSTVQGQGWNMIPTWVGPQAPCASHNFYTMSGDPQVAFSEGQREAGDAAVAAKELGLTTQDWGGTVLYYDLEPYPNEPGCREAVKSFMAGWTSRLHQLGNQAGAYGAACASYLEDWVLEAPYTLDQIWPAAWIYPGYNANASVWDVSCIDDSLWSEHQRIRQYAGDHNERWGNLTFNIDSNIVDGQVAGSIPRAQAASEGPEQEAVQEEWRPLQVSGMQRLTEGKGWLIANGQFLWSEDGGATWMERRPNDLDLTVHAASFLNEAQGWLVASSAPDAQGRSTFYLGKSADSGVTWDVQPIDAFDPAVPLSMHGPVELTFFDANTGYLQVKVASSSNFELYTLLKSVDGGTTWHVVAVPQSSPVHFVDALNGWTQATTSEATRQMTNDGGASWHLDEASFTAAESTVALAVAAAKEATGARAATMLENGTGWAFVEHGLCSGAKPQADGAQDAETEAFACLQSNALLATSDGGATWIDITPQIDTPQIE